MCFSRDGRRLLIATLDGQLVLWDVRRDAPLDVLRTDASGVLTALALARDERTAYSVGRDGRLTTSGGGPVLSRLPDGTTERAQRELAEGRWALFDSWTGASG